MNSTLEIVISTIQSNILAIEENMALYKEANFESRANARDFIDFQVIDHIEALLHKAAPAEILGALRQHAEKVKRRLEKTDLKLFKQIREEIGTGVYTRSSFRNMIWKYVVSDVSDMGRTGKPGYDNLDLFINGILFREPIPEATIERKPEMVFYQKTPVRVVLEMMDMAHLRQDDIFFDLGSGLGQVAMLVNLISGATAKGIEYEPAYYNYAKACASQLNLSKVEFMNADAREVGYLEGTIFFMYTPFEGSMLQDTLHIIQKESLKRTIRIFTYGSCSPHVARQPWLICVNGNADDIYNLCEFRS